MVNDNFRSQASSSHWPRGRSFWAHNKWNLNFASFSGWEYDRIPVQKMRTSDSEIFFLCFRMRNPPCFYLSNEIPKWLRYCCSSIDNARFSPRAAYLMHLRKLTLVIGSALNSNWTLLFAMTKDATFCTFNPWRNGCWPFDARVSILDSIQGEDKSTWRTQIPTSKINYVD